MAWRLSSRSRRRLAGVDHRLVRVVERALELSPLDFMVLEGLRTVERQAHLVRAGASRTYHSKHLSGHAVDLGALLDGELRWDWPLYSKLAVAMKQAARELDTPIIWGGDWRTFKDGPHFEMRHVTPSRQA